MATKRRPLRDNYSSYGASGGVPGTNTPPPSSQRTFRAGTERPEARGTRPVQKPTSVKEILTMVLLHVCKKTIFFDVNLKVALYLGSLFLVSLIGDFVPFPRSYFSRSDNLFNVYFVKIGWFWTLLFSVPYLALSSYTICCGDIKRLYRNHFPRIAIATMFWYGWTKFFNVIETTFGRCSTRGFETKSTCLKAGHLWQGFDISGHAFILIYSSLVLIEEARPIVNWEAIKDLLRNEEHNRNGGDGARGSLMTNPLKNLKDDQIKNLQVLYQKYTPLVRILFVGMTALQLLWDVMLVCTMLYYHNMVEKVISGIIAILTWYFTYRAWYPSSKFLPDKPGKGLFVYQKEKAHSGQLPSAARRNTTANGNGGNGGGSAGQAPKFMGMPLNVNAGLSTPTSGFSINPASIYGTRRHSQEFFGVPESGRVS